METEKKILKIVQLSIIGFVVLAAVVVALVIAFGGGTPEETTAPTQTEQTTQSTQPATVATNPLAISDFAYEGDYLTCLSQPSVLGIDVSVWQGDIDWQQVKEAGVEFVMIRLAWRGSEQGVLSPDKNAQKNYEGAKAAGLKVGGYIFSQSITPQEAVEEANYVLDMIDGWELDMPIAYDWEYISADSRTGDMDGRTLTDCTRAFCQTIQAAGYEPIIYFNQEQSLKTMYLEELTDYQFWLAMYDTYMTYPYQIHMWQYTCTGKVPGIQGDVDINLYFQYE